VCSPAQSYWSVLLTNESAASAILSADQKQRLIAGARAMLDRAYAPYSKFRVGAAILTETGNIYTGCNVENASYGVTNCAERTAIFTAVAAEGPGMKVKAVAVLNSQSIDCSPCGACRQVIYEFGSKALVIYQGNGSLSEATAEQLLPAGFHF
jgi:cytidine deaminase